MNKKIIFTNFVHTSDLYVCHQVEVEVVAEEYLVRLKQKVV